MDADLQTYYDWLNIEDSPRALRFKAVRVLGGKCKRCGNRDYRVLQIDHIDGGGAEERRSFGVNYFKAIPLRVLDERTRPNYQLLCANCNWIKRVERQEWRKRVQETA